MKVRIVVGGIEVETQGIDMTQADVRRLLTRIVTLAADVALEPWRPDAEPRNTDVHLAISAGDVPMFGFTRFLDGDPEIPDEDVR